MEFANGNGTGLDEQDQVDIVSGWLRKLAIGMVAVGILFAALDRYHFFQQSTERPQVQAHHVPA